MQMVQTTPTGSQTYSTCVLAMASGSWNSRTRWTKEPLKGQFSYADILTCYCKQKHRQEKVTYAFGVRILVLAICRLKKRKAHPVLDAGRPSQDVSGAFKFGLNVKQNPWSSTNEDLICRYKYMCRCYLYVSK